MDGSIYKILKENKMKKLYFFVILIAAVVLVSCEEEPVGQQPLDETPPGRVSDVVVKNTPGGALLTYNLPDDEDLLFVKAIYSRENDKKSESVASVYSDTLMVEGFGDTLTHEVEIITVDRSRNESSPVKVNIQPLEPPVLSIGESLNMVEDFGGIQAFWENTNREEIAVVILIEDEFGEYVPFEKVYSSVVEGSATKRGLDTIPYNFGVHVEDRWGNKSETKYFNLVPLFEEQFPKGDFRELFLPGDVPGDAWGWSLSNLWDGVIGDARDGVHTHAGTGIWPHVLSFDIGHTGKVSRFIIYPRTVRYLYSGGNLKVFELWGSDELDMTGDWENWTKLGTYESFKPSGLPDGENTAEDLAYAQAGEEFVVPISAPEVRYIRLRVLETWGNVNFVHFQEIDFYGKYR